MSWLRLGRSSTSTSTSSSRNGGGSRSQGLDSAGIYVEPFFDLNPPLFIIHPNSARPGGPAKTSTTVSGHFEIELEHQETFQQLSARLFPRYYATDGASACACAFSFMLLRCADPILLDAFLIVQITRTAGSCLARRATCRLSRSSTVPESTGEAIPSE